MSMIETLPGLCFHALTVTLHSSSPAAQKCPEIKQARAQTLLPPSFLPPRLTSLSLPLTTTASRSSLTPPHSHVRLTPTGPLQARPTRTQPSHPGPHRKFRHDDRPLA